MSHPAKQSAAPRKDRNAAIEQGIYSEIVLSSGNFTLLAEGLGSHWQQLDQWARTRYQEISKGGSFAHHVLARHMHQLPKMHPMEDQEVIIFLIRNFLDWTKGQASVEDAVVYLARSFWDVRLATYRWIDPDTYAAIEKDEVWGDEEDDETNLGNPLDIRGVNIHEVSIGFHTGIEISLTRASDDSSCRPEEYQPALRRTKYFTDPRTSS